MIDPFFVAMATGSFASAVAAGWLYFGGRSSLAAAVEDDMQPEPLLSKFRMSDALVLNTFPRQSDRACSSCNGRALVWARDERRHDAWVGSCRRCGMPRIDVVAGVALES